MKNPAITAFPPALQTDSQIGEFVIQKLLQFSIRTLVVWGFLAIFLPQLGVTYAMVLCGLVALRMARGYDNQILVNAIVRKAK
jgi:hypothetical protein